MSILEHTIWAKVEYNNLYLVSINGDIYSTKTNRVLKLGKSQAYAAVTFSEASIVKRHRVHKLVSLAFIKNTYNKPHINHIDFNTINNKVENLEWCTPAENIQHSIKHGRHIDGNKVTAEILKTYTIEEIEYELSRIIENNLTYSDSYIPNSILSGAVNNYGVYSIDTDIIYAYNNYICDRAPTDGELKGYNALKKINFTCTEADIKYIEEHLVDSYASVARHLGWYLQCGRSNGMRVKRVIEYYNLKDRL